MSKTFWKRAGFGAVAGIAACYILTALLSDPLPAAQAFIDAVGSLRAAMLIQALLLGLYGALCMGLTVIYDVERLPLLFSSLIHCACIVFLFMPIAHYLRWFDDRKELLITAGIQIAAYLVIWLILNTIYKNEIKELNHLQTQMRNKNPKEEVQ